MIKYLERTRSYYGALGYPSYQWADNAEAPFAIPSKGLSASRLGLVTTAAPLRDDVGDQGPGATYNAAAKFFEVFRQPMSPLPDLRISHIGYDRAHCEADDPATWLPVAQLQQACADGRVGELAPELVGAPTNRSQRITLEKDAPAVLAALRDQQVDLAILVPT